MLLVTQIYIYSSTNIKQKFDIVKQIQKRQNSNIGEKRLRKRGKSSLLILATVFSLNLKFLHYYSTL